MESVLSLLCIILGIFSLVSISIAASGVQSGFNQWAVEFWKAYGVLGFYLPAILICFSFLAVAKKDHTEVIWYLASFSVVVLTLRTLALIYNNSQTDGILTSFLTTNFGRTWSLLFLSLLTIFEIYLITIVASILSRKKNPTQSDGNLATPPLSEERIDEPPSRSPLQFVDLDSIPQKKSASENSSKLDNFHWLENEVQPLTREKKSIDEKVFNAGNPLGELTPPPQEVKPPQQVQPEVQPQQVTPPQEVQQEVQPQQVTPPQEVQPEVQTQEVKETEKSAPEVQAHSYDWIDSEVQPLTPQQESFPESVKETENPLKTLSSLSSEEVREYSTDPASEPDFFATSQDDPEQEEEEFQGFSQIPDTQLPDEKVEERADENEIQDLTGKFSSNLEERESFNEKELSFGDGRDILSTELEREMEVESRIETLNNILDSTLDVVIEDPEEYEFSEEENSVHNDLRSWNEYSVPMNLLIEHPDPDLTADAEERMKLAKILEETFAEFKIKTKVTGVKRGPVITMLELLPAPGVKLSRITSLADNIALRLAAKSVRIVAPIPGRHAVGIEVPNKTRELVGFKNLLSRYDKQRDDIDIPFALGTDISGEAQIIDIRKMPHLLIAGATGAGKSVCVNSLICSILYTKTPADVRLLMVDPKIVELKLYNDIPHLLTPVITDPTKALQALRWAVGEMERRYALLDGLAVRDVSSYNSKLVREKVSGETLPFIVIIIDEFADLMATSGKELEGIIARLAAMSRAVGLHLVLATQRPSIDVITGLIKANFPSRIAFSVASRTDSRIILDESGAEKLLGRGDMLFSSGGSPSSTRLQGAFLSEEEVEQVAGYVRGLGKPNYIEDEIFYEDEQEDFSDIANDPLLQEALEVISTAGKASASFLQRKLKIGYNRAARMIEGMEQMGYVGAANGSKPREILL